MVFGGNNATNVFNSVHVLEKTGDDWTWFHPCMAGQAPGPRTGHSATLIDETTILIYGGWDAQDSSSVKTYDDVFLLKTGRS